MSARIDYSTLMPAAVRALVGLDQYVRRTGLEPALLELVKLRTSYLNGCAYCVDVHTKEARAAGESERRLYAVPVWRETPFFSHRERAALQWTDAVTELGRIGVADHVYEEVRGQFSEEELVNLTMAVIAINGWNRLAVSFRKEPGTYELRTQHHAMATAG